MHRQFLNVYGLVLVRKIKSSYFKVAPGGLHVNWTPSQGLEGGNLGRARNLRTLGNGNNSATVIAMNPVKIAATNADSKSTSSGSAKNSVSVDEPEEIVRVERKEEGGQEKKANRKSFPVINSQQQSIMEATIQNEKDVNTLLDFALAGGLTLRAACQIVFRLGQLSQQKSSAISKMNIWNDERFNGFCKLIQKGNHSQVPHFLLLAIRGFQNLGPTSEGQLLIQELENELKWCMRRCPVRFLARATELLANPSKRSEETPGGPQDAFYVATQTLQRRWAEVSTGSDFVMVFKVINHLSAETRDKLEDRAVELVQEFTSLEMVKMFIALAGQKRRPTPLLRALAFHLSKSTEKIPVKDLVELIFALNELTFADPVLMQKLCTELHGEIESIKNPSWISSLATSLGQMRYLNKELMESLEEWISKHLDELRPFDCASWLLASSVFYLNSTKQQGFFTKAKSKLSPERAANPSEWLNIVHALVILSQANPDLVSTVLKPEFVKKIDSLNENNVSARLKLLNINAMAKSGDGGMLVNYKGPLLPQDFVKKWASTTGENDLHLSKVVLESLSNFLPPPKYLRSGIKTESGVFIDAICVLNEKTDPVPVDSSMQLKGAIKVAIVVQGYPVMCLGSKVPTGSSLLNTRLLEKEGYLVISVPYTEFSPKEKILRRVQYLEQKVRNANAQNKNKSPTDSEQMVQR